MSTSNFISYTGKRGYSHIRDKHGHKIKDIIIFLFIIAGIIISLNWYSTTEMRGSDAAGDFADDITSVSDNPIVKIFSGLTTPFEKLFGTVGDTSENLWVYWTKPFEWDDKGDLEQRVKKTEGEDYNAVEIYEAKTEQTNVMPVSRTTSFMVAYQNLGTQVPKELYITMSLGDRLVENGAYIKPRGTGEGDDYKSYYESYTPVKAVINISKMPKNYGSSGTSYDNQVFYIKSPVCPGNFPLELNIKYNYETSSDWDPEFRIREVVDMERQQAKDREKELSVTKAASLANTLLPLCVTVSPRTLMVQRSFL